MPSERSGNESLVRWWKERGGSAHNSKELEDQAGEHAKQAHEKLYFFSKAD